MDVAEYYFGFHRMPTIAELRAGVPLYSVFGHVEAFGYTIDETWFFYDPGRHLAKLKITHLHDEVNALLAEKFNTCKEVIRYSRAPLEFTGPFHGPMNCVTQCAALVGMRAFTPWGFRKKLLAHNAEVIHEVEQGRS